MNNFALFIFFDMAAECLQRVNGIGITLSTAHNTDQQQADKQSFHGSTFSSQLRESSCLNHNHSPPLLPRRENPRCRPQYYYVPPGDFVAALGQRAGASHQAEVVQHWGAGQWKEKEQQILLLLR